MRRVKNISAQAFMLPAFISTSFDWHGKQFLKEDKNGAHCIVTAVNKKRLRQSHCVNVGKLVSPPLSLPTKETDTPPTPPSVDFSHSPLVLIKIFANRCCSRDHVAKLGGWLFRVFMPIFIKKVRHKKQKHFGLVEHIQGKATLYSRNQPSSL